MRCAALFFFFFFFFFFSFFFHFYCILLNSRSLSLSLSMCEVVWKSIIFWLSCTATGPKLCSFIKMSHLNNPLCLPPISLPLSLSLSSSPPLVSPSLLLLFCSLAVSLRRCLNFHIKDAFLAQLSENLQYFLSCFECGGVLRAIE